MRFPRGAPSLGGWLPWAASRSLFGHSYLQADRVNETHSTQIREVVVGGMDLSRPSLVVAFELSERRKAIVADVLAGAGEAFLLRTLERDHSR